MIQRSCFRIRKQNSHKHNHAYHPYTNTVNNNIKIISTHVDIDGRRTPLGTRFDYF